MFRKLMLLGICFMFMTGLVLAQEDAPPPTLDDHETRLKELENKMQKQVTSPDTFRAYWKDGLNFKSVDGNFALKIGGRMHIDFLTYTGNSEMEKLIGSGINGGTEIRRARLNFEGTIHQNTEFKSQIDFAAGEGAFKDMYLKLNGLPFGFLQIGQFDEPFSLEELTSSNYNVFIERSLPNAFVPSRNTGIMVGHNFLNDGITFNAGYFKDTDDFGNHTDGAGGGENNWTARLTGLPVNNNKGEQLVHLGLGYTRRLPNDDTVRFRSRPEVHIGPRLVDTKDIKNVNNYDMVNAEFAVVQGPLMFQAEYIYANVNSENSENSKLIGSYAFVSYFLTGEHHRYSAKSGKFDKTIPISAYDGKEGRGAWEVAFRFSQLDLEDGPIHGGDLTDYSGGLNWYINTNTRFQFNYIHAHLKNEGKQSEQMNQFLTRFMIYW